MEELEIEKILEKYTDVWDGDWDGLKGEIYEACLLWVRIFYSPIEAFAMERTMANIKANAANKAPHSDEIPLSSIPMRKDSLLLILYNNNLTRGTRVGDLFKRARLQNPFLRIMDTTETSDIIRARMYMTHPCLALLYMVNALTHMVEHCASHVQGVSYKTWRMIRWLTHVEESLKSCEDKIYRLIPVEEEGFRLDNADLPPYVSADMEIPLFRRLCQTYAYLPETKLEAPLEELEAEKKLDGLETEHMSYTMNAFKELYERLHAIMAKNDQLTTLWDTIFIPYLSRKDTGERNTYVQKFVRVEDNNRVRGMCLLTRYKRSIRREDGDYLDLKRDVHYMYRPVHLPDESVQLATCSLTAGDAPLSFLPQDVPLPVEVTYSDSEPEENMEDGLYHAYDWEAKLVHEFELEFNRMEHRSAPVFMVWENCLDRTDAVKFDELATFCSNITILTKQDAVLNEVRERGLKEPILVTGSFETWVDARHDSYVLVLGENTDEVVDGQIIVASQGLFSKYSMSQWLDICTTGRNDTINT